MSEALKKELNKQVANWSVLYTKLHNFHWYVKGPSFFTLHAKFEELYNEATLNMDEIAERLLTLGEAPVATLKEHLELSDIKEAKNKESADEMVQAVVEDFDKIMKSLKKGMDEAAKEEDDMTEDMLNAIYQKTEKHQWMLNAFLGDTNETKK
ncbi:Dps family protein [Psychrobacillus lasiicapitis]|uniref:DNA starvation/stationary phase protection protein n=1 Tax=Psychrobacillus lasiicapitis TaxID=1636719 RepID=A0A544T9B4_9BACI|nr:DNA starvation/stationary phase protection protein [Psychrobacillus lasiicapitis]TQR14035.1 DNA starvation/stationary phase protection protein [Psychrobacillus lasiicapitis]GGA37609.1 DNA starvation/stationary phase protection protein [Psychrobacillus lasiicapitis]